MSRWGSERARHLSQTTLVTRPFSAVSDEADDVRSMEGKPLRSTTPIDRRPTLSVATSANAPGCITTGEPVPLLSDTKQVILSIPTTLTFGC